jgi:long-chain acyl-CoA synthetase
MTKGPTTLNELFNFAVDRYRDKAMLRFKREGNWQSLNYGDVARRVRELALGLYELGLRSGDKIAIWSENRPEWNVADLAVLALGAADVPIYTTQALNQVEFILKDSETKAIFVSKSFVNEIVALRESLPSLRYIITFDSLALGELPAALLNAEGMMDRGRSLFGRQAGLYETLWHSVTPQDLATLIYTSGTTGDPKGVMLTYDNLTQNVMNVVRWLKLDGIQDEALTYLPFSHIFERVVWYLYAHCGTSIAYAESIETVATNLAEIKPTVMTSVPRMFEKLYSKIIEKGLAAGFPKKQIFQWSLGVGKRWAEAKDKGEPIAAGLALQHNIADALVFKKWREVMGGRIRVLISGGAALAPEIAYAFAGAGLKILQGYGLTETSPSISCNTEAANRIGTVGKIIDGVEVRIAEDGEIQVRGRTIMQGYYNRPEENAMAFTKDGWFCTGDIGHFDKDGFLVITDRKKDLIKTSGGKYIAPQVLESLIKSSPFVSQVVVVGNGRKFAAALVVANLEMLRNYAELKGIHYANDEELIRHPKITDLVQRQVDKHTEGLAKYERVKKVAVLLQEMTIESGDLTPTLKPRRSVIEKKYASVIDRLYAEAEERVTVA